MVFSLILMVGVEADIIDTRIILSKRVSGSQARLILSSQYLAKQSYRLVKSRLQNSKYDNVIFNLKCYF